MFYHKKIAGSLLGLTAAFSLPPRMLEINLKPEVRMSANVREREALKIEKWDSRPSFHGGMRVVPGAVEVLSEDGERVIRYVESLGGGLKPGLERKRSVSVDNFFPMNFLREKQIASPSSQIRLLESGDMFLELPRGPVETLWKINLGLILSGLDSQGSRPSRPTFTGWSAAPATLIKFDWGLRSDGGQAALLRVEWDKKSDILSFEQCREGQFIVIERLRNGLAQISFLHSRRPENLELVSYAKLSLGTPLRREEVSAVAHRNCQQFYFIGTFGLIKATY